MSRRTAACLLALALGLSAAACRRAGEPSEAASAAAKRYAIEGVVRRLDAAKPEITLDHGPIEGYMDAMTMSFPVRADRALLSRLRVGDRISGTLVVDGDRFWLEGIAAPPPAPAAAMLPAGTASAAVVTPHPNSGVALGDPMPDFTLRDQSGGLVRLSALRGEPVALTFLYTRCPVATACPMTTAKFSRLGAMLKDKGFGMLLTITVDPEHDTPQVLADYAKRAGADPKRWRFLTGESRAVADVAEKFGVLYYPDHGQVVHTQAVAVVGPEGKLSSIYYGENWQPEDIFRDMEKARKG